MPTKMDKRIILSGVPVCWIHKISGGAITKLWNFDNLQSAIYKIIRAATASSTGEYVEIKRSDAAIIKFPKFNLQILGTDETDVTPATASSDATGLGEFTIVLNEAPVDYASINSWTAFIKSVKENADSLFLITIPTGFTWESRSSGTPASDGYVHMIGKLNTDIEQTLGESPSSLSMTFISYMNTDAGLTNTEIETATFDALSWKGKTATFTPALTTGDGAILAAGEVLVVASKTYSYA